MAVDAEQMAAASTAADTSAAREEQPVPDSSAATDGAETPAPAPVDRDAWLSQYRNAPDDVRKSMTDALIQEEPIRQTMSAENSRAIQRAQQQAQQERAQREALERDLILADEDHDQHYDYASKYGTQAVEDAKKRVGLRAALERPEVRATARIETARTIIGQLMQHETFAGITEQEWATALDAEDIGTALGQTFTTKLERELASRLEKLAPAISAKTLDDYRAGLPNPDTGRSVTAGRTGNGLTAERLREMRRTGDPALKTIPASEIDRVVAQTLARAQPQS